MLFNSVTLYNPFAEIGQIYVTIKFVGNSLLLGRVDLGGR